MSWEFFTNSTAPWWATVALPIVTLLVGQRFTSKAARDQRNDEIRAAADLRRDEAANKATEREHERAAAEAARQAAADEAKEARFNAIFDNAMDGIHALQAELASYAGTGKMNDDAVRQLAVALGHIRVDILQSQTNQYRTMMYADIDTFNPDWIVKDTIEVRHSGAGVPQLSERLSALANAVYELREVAARVRSEGS